MGGHVRCEWHAVINLYGHAYGKLHCNFGYDSKNVLDTDCRRKHLNKSMTCSTNYMEMLAFTQGVNNII